MADIDVSKIKLPGDNNDYILKDAKKTGIYTVIGTQKSSTSSWTGNISVPALYDGLTIMYYLPYASTSSNVTLKLTLSTGIPTGAISCYYSTSKLTTHYGKGCNIVMTYWSAGSISIDGTATTNNRWIANANYTDGNTNTWRAIKVNDTQLLGTGTSTGAVNFKSGTNITISGSNNDIIIAESHPYVRKLLWENHAMAAYSTGTIEINLSEYEYVEIICAYTNDSMLNINSGNKTGSSLIKKNTKGCVSIMSFQDNTTDNRAINYVFRYFYPKDTGVEYLNGQMYYNFAPYRDWSNRCVPYEIIGIKLST